MPSLSPAASAGPAPNTSTTAPHPRPPLAKRHSGSSSAQALAKQNLISPGSTGEQHALKHPVRTNRHAKIVLPRNHSSGRNLAKLARQAQKEQFASGGGDDSYRHSRQRSHEGDTEIRLPGSLDESEARPPPMRRNLTAYQLPKTTSHIKLKKNLSHGHLSRLQPGRNAQALSSGGSRAPLSPGLRGKTKRSKSGEMATLLAEPNLHQREEELLRAQQTAREAKPKVGFAVGSAGDSTEGDDNGLDMEGSGLQEDEWTEESASASPLSTRQNTANNSRRASTTERHTVLPPPAISNPTSGGSGKGLKADPGTSEEEETSTVSEATVTDDDAPSPPRSPMGKKERRAEADNHIQQVSAQARAPQRSPLHAAKDYPNPATRRTLSQHSSLPAPALVSNVSALDDRGSPSASMLSSRSNLEGSAEQEDELVSRFIPSGSHPSTGSGGNTTMSTPKQGGWHTPTDDSGLQRVRASTLHAGTHSPGSTISATSSGNTPAQGRSRIELKLLGEKALADREAAAERAPMYPHHLYDRRNETLKSYLNLASLGGDGRGGIGPHSALSLGPEIFQGRFKAVNTELKVVQRFRDPIRESVVRLKHCKGSKLGQRKLKSSKSAVALTSQRGPPTKPPVAGSSPPVGEHVELSRSSGATQSVGVTDAQHSIRIGQSADGNSKSIPADARRSGVRRGVSFAGPPIVKAEESDAGPDAAARMLWEDLA